MSGAAGGQRIKKADVERTFNDYVEKVLSKIPGFKEASLSGSVKARTKTDYGDLDLIIYFEGTDKKEVKKDIINVINSLPDSITVPFKSEKYAGRKYYNAGELISVLFPISGTGETIQVDNIIALTPEEKTYKISFLDLPAEKQGLLIGLAKVILLEENPQEVFDKLGIKNVPPLEEDEEYEFNLSSNKLTLRIVKLQDFKEIGRKEVWSTTDWTLVDSLFKNFNTEGDFEDLLNSIDSTVRNPRSKRRIAEVFGTMVSVKSGEVGTPKGDGKVFALNKVKQILTENTNGTVGLYAGGFKPPHKGHFKIAKTVSEKVDKLVIFIGPVIRAGEPISPGQSKAIWEIYKKYLPNTEVEIIESEVTPIRDLYEWIEKNQDNVDSIVIGATVGESNKKYAHLNKYPEKYTKVRLMEIPYTPSEADDKLSATDIRNNPEYLAELEWTPQELSQKDRTEVYKILKGSIQEMTYNLMEADLATTLDKFKGKREKKEIAKEGSSGAAIDSIGAQPSKDRNKLLYLYNRLRELIYKKDFEVEFAQDRIVITIRDQARVGYDYTPHMASILEYMLDEGIKITPLPEIKIRRDMTEAVDFFGKTAYYDPNLKEVILYVEGRHPKDVMRSFVHEMIHHKQNLEGRLQGINTTNTNEDSNLNELEQEAYLLGNTTFRNWEDKVKNNG